MNDETLRTIIVALLGAGGATFIWTLVRSYIALRSSAEGREDKAIARLERFEEDCRNQLKEQRVWGNHWYNRAARLEFEMIRQGVTPPEDPQPPALPSQPPPDPHRPDPLP